MTTDVKHLFSTRGLSEFLESRNAAMLVEVDRVDRQRLLNTSPDDLADYYDERYTVESIVLDEDNIVADQEESDIDVTGDPIRDFGSSRSVHRIRGTSYSVHVPFSGEKALFELRPSRYTTCPPRGATWEDALVLVYQKTDHDADALKNEIDNDLKEVKEWLQWVNADVDKFNQGLRDQALSRISKRRAKALKDQGVVAALGFPIRKRDDAPRTYATPAVRRKLRPTMPSASEKPFTPEPTLPDEEYEHILGIIRSMVRVIERSPNSFKDLDEEDLRTHFLVQLNGHYEGQATGETFNASGKTDILIRADDRNIFIAECKFWKGAKSLTAALNQLLGYATWRDAKLALLIFNQQKDFSAVLAKLPDIIIQHPTYKRQSPNKHEAEFRFVVHHPDDKNRELHLAVLAFEVPK